MFEVYYSVLILEFQWSYFWFESKVRTKDEYKFHNLNWY